ncbi:MAG TPA: PAS domain-containing protein [Bryobacteraceae bacterium]|nr:PAS domain-containing protein [Bryobacteraceae bacterium]
MPVFPATHADVAILDQLQDGVIVVNPEGTIEYANPAARRLLATLVAGPESWEPAHGPPPPVQKALRTLPSLPASIVVEGLHLEVVAAEGGRIITAREITNPVGEFALERERRLAAERCLEQKQEFTEAVLDNIGTGIAVCDETGTLHIVNRAMRALGSPETPAAAEHWAENCGFMYPDGVTPLRREDNPLYRAFQGETVRDVEIVVAPKDAPRRTLLATGRPLFGRDGRKIGAVLATRDVTHRRLSTRRVREAFRHFRTLFKDAPIAYHEIDCDGVIRRVNRAECRLLGRTREEIIGRCPWEFVSENEREKSRRAVQDTLAGVPPLTPAEREYVTADGRHIVLEVHENLIADESGRIVGIRTAMLDITDRRRHEQQEQAIVREKASREQAEAASAEIRSILERIGDAYIAFDTEWRYTYVNQKAAELALKPAEELLGKCVWDEFPESVHTAFYTELQRSLREQISVAFENYYAPLGKWFENSVYPSPSGVSVFYRDITERKQTEQALQKRTAQLAAKNAELEAFAYMASHDLQEPLRIVSTYTAMLSNRYAGVLGGDADTFIRYVVDGAARMQDLVRDLLALCRAGTMDLARVQDVSAAAALESAAGHLAGAVTETGATFEFRDLPRVRAIESHLVQLFQNLLANAMKYRSDAPPQIRVAAERLPAGWRFSVADNGAGFHMSQAEHIFEPFKRLRRHPAGTGIGLSICRKIVEARGGRIWAEAAPGAGATFYFTIPDEIPAGD